MCELTADDCFRLGAVAYFNQDYYHTVMWITEALNVWQTEQQKTVDKAVLLDYLSYSLYMVLLLTVHARVDKCDSQINQHSTLIYLRADQKHSTSLYDI